MSEVENWAEGRDPMLAAFAIIAASSSDVLYELIHHKSNIDAKILKEWQRYYRKPWKMYVSLGFHLEGMPDGNTKNRKDLLRLIPLMFLNKLPTKRMQRNVLSRHLDFRTLNTRGPGVEAMLADALSMPRVFETATSKNSALDSFENSAAAQFFAHVWIPCWALNQRSINSLVVEATDNFQALESLLKFDKFALEIQDVRKHYHDIMASGNHVRIQMLTKAVAQDELGKLTMLDVKSTVGALIYMLNRRWNESSERVAEDFGLDIPKRRFGPSDVRKLYDAIAKDRGELQDSDLQDGYDAFRKMIGRHAKKWIVESAGTKIFL